MKKQADPINHARFIELLNVGFPEVVAGFDPSQKGLLHCEMGAFVSAVERWIDEGRFWLVEKAFRFIQQIMLTANPAVENAIEVSFLEDLALGEFTDVRYRAIKERMPKELRAKLVEINGRWK